jgi:hypothetical protein
VHIPDRPKFFAIALIRTGLITTTTANIVVAAEAWEPGTCWGAGETPLQAKHAAEQMAKFFRGEK